MYNPKTPPPPTTTNPQLENMKSLIMGCTTKPLTPNQEAYIEKFIQENFLDRPTPDHPPYAFMIEDAIEELNEEGGSSEAVISKFILEKHKSLPWHHEAFLKHQLRKLCDSGELVESHDGYYMIPQASQNGTRSSSSPSSGCTSSWSSIPKQTGTGLAKNATVAKLDPNCEVAGTGAPGRGRGRSRGRGRGRSRRGRGGGRGRDCVNGQPCKENMEGGKDEMHMVDMQKEEIGKNIESSKAAEIGGLRGEGQPIEGYEFDDDYDDCWGELGGTLVDGDDENPVPLPEWTAEDNSLVKELLASTR